MFSNCRDSARGFTGSIYICLSASSKFKLARFVITLTNIRNITGGLKR